MIFSKQRIQKTIFFLENLMNALRAFVNGQFLETFYKKKKKEEKCN